MNKALLFSLARKISLNINSKTLYCALRSQSYHNSCVSVLVFFILARDLLIFLEMKAVIAALFVLFCLLLPSDCASSDKKNVSIATKVRF